MAKKGEITIDVNRHLCENCKLNIDTCDSDPVFGERTDIINVIKCTSYRKSTLLYKRVKPGETYWWFNNKFEVKEQKEQESPFDIARSENGNYFYSEEECNIAINKIKIK